MIQFTFCGAGVRSAGTAVSSMKKFELFDAVSSWGFLILVMPPFWLPIICEDDSL